MEIEIYRSIDISISVVCEEKDKDFLTGITLSH